MSIRRTGKLERERTFIRAHVTMQYQYMCYCVCSAVYYMYHFYYGTTHTIQGVSIPISSIINYPEPFMWQNMSENLASYDRQLLQCVQTSREYISYFWFKVNKSMFFSLCVSLFTPFIISLLHYLHQFYLFFGNFLPF